MSTHLFDSDYNATASMIADAINLSVSQTEIVHLHVRPEFRDGMAFDLFGECEDAADAGDVTEYWGVDADGAEWRIHLH